MPPFVFSNTYVALPETLYARVSPTPVRKPSWILTNDDLARELGVDLQWLASEDGALALSGNALLEGAEPLAQAYAGHQFGHLVPRLGDGRAILLGEVVDCNGQRRDIQLKGAGRTPFSRGGDGRAAVGPVLREYIVSEAMHALGIPTTRSLAAVRTGESVYREAALPGAVLTRVAASHVRVGTFQYVALRGEQEALRALTAFVCERHYPEARDSSCPPIAMLRAIMNAQIALVARWMGVGFIHGVMNTDNTTVSGETIDYGPCAFMDAFDVATVFSSIDHGGRYAYGAQRNIIGWNLCRLAETLVPIIDKDQDTAVEQAQEVLHEFPALMEDAWLSVMASKLGLSKPRPEDRELVFELLNVLQRQRADFTNFFRALGKAAATPGDASAAMAELDEGEALHDWLRAWRHRLEKEGREPHSTAEAMGRVNPAYIPRNHRVEAVLTDASEGRTESLEKLLAVLARPYEDQPENAAYRRTPESHERVHQTFCGT